MSVFNSSHRVIAAVLVLGGCASAAVPTNRVASTEAAIRAAQESGVAGTPDAALHLHYAELERAEAQRLMQNGDSDHAVGQFQRAEADANLALALTREAAAEHDAQVANNAVGAAYTSPR